MAKRFRLGLMCCASFVAACDDEASQQAATSDPAVALAADAPAPWIDAAVPVAPLDASIDQGQTDASTPPDGEADVCDRLTYANTGAPFFATYCAPCHRLPQPTFNSIAEVSNFRRRIETRLFESPRAPMPPSNAPKQPPVDEKGKLQQWLRCVPLD